MSDRPWITIVGIGEDGPDGLPPASLAALKAAEVVMGATRHLALLPAHEAEVITWPIPFVDGLPLLRSLEGRDVVVLASGDPFWFGAGAVIARAFAPYDWTVLPAPSCFALAAARMGWALERTICLGLHAQPMSHIRPYLGKNTHLLVTLRDGQALEQLGAYLTEIEFRDSIISAFQALGGPREARWDGHAHAIKAHGLTHPICVAIESAGPGAALPVSSGIADAFFQSDGVMTKRAVRAATLSALAPQRGEVLWDIGAGSGSIAIEWLLADPACNAVAVEPRKDRIAMIEHNAQALGVAHLQLVAGSAPDVFADLPDPDAVFIGGGLTTEMLRALEDRVKPGTRVVANTVTLEGEHVLITAHQRLGGDLIQINIAEADALGGKTGWKPARPIVQWAGVL